MLWDCPTVKALWMSAANILNVNINWQSIVMGSKALGSVNQVISLIAYILYKKHIIENEQNVNLNYPLKRYVIDQLEWRKEVYGKCKGKEIYVEIITNLTAALQ